MLHVYAYSNELMLLDDKDPTPWSSNLGFLMHKSMGVTMRLVSKIEWCLSKWDSYQDDLDE